MSDQNITPIVTKPAAKGGFSTGIILVAIGLGLLATQLFSWAEFFPLVLGLGLITAGIWTRKAGLIIPGGIIGGAGLGMVVMENNWLAPMGSVAGGGVFLLAMSLGWFSITLLSKLFTDETQTWALFPGACRALIGGLVLMGEQGLVILKAIGTYWPLILVAVGLRILYRWNKNRS